MPDTVAEQLHKAAQALFLEVSTSGQDIAGALNSTLNQFLVWPYRASAACVTDSERMTPETFGSIIYTSSQQTNPPPEPANVKTETVACVIHSVHTLTPEELGVAYDKIRIIKQLKKTPIQNFAPGQIDTPLGIVFAIEASEPVETLAEHVILLNKSYPSSEWPDMVVILKRGTINYAVQFEGDPVGGDFFLPNERRSPVFPMYVHVFLRSLGLHSFNRMCAMMFVHLQIFSPGTKLPDMKVVLDGVSQHGMNVGGYWFDRKSQLVPVPDEMRQDRGVGFKNLPFRIENDKGELLCHVVFVPWQHGGAIRVIGKMPLEVFLVLLGPVVKDAQRIKRADGEISSVLPITRQEFLDMLARFQRQSNMRVRPEQPSWTVSKMADEGTSSPFMARVFLGITRLRRLQFPKGKRDAFDKAYEFALMTLMSTRSTAQEIVAMLIEHKERVSKGEKVRLVGNTIYEDEPINRELSRKVEEFLNSASRVVKEGMQSVATVLNLDIGFLFKKKNSFEKGIAKLTKTHPELAVYLTETRKWSERLIDGARNAMEHDGWKLPRVTYKRVGDRLEVVEPEILGEPVSIFVEHMIDRVCCFVEEVSAYGLQKLMPSDFSITEIPLAQRKPECTERFQLALALGGMPFWSLAYHNAKFEET
jgi:hypothetical protein